MLDYRLLEALAMVVDEGGFERAAARLHITQSAVSQRIRTLEDQSGQVLLIRTNPPAATPAGQQLLRHFRQVNLLEQNLAEGMAENDEQDLPSLPIGINADSLALWFMDAVEPFLEKKSAVLDLRVDDQEETHGLLRDGEVMGCISSRDKPMQGCSASLLGYQRYYLACTPAFLANHFGSGVNGNSVAKAPAIIFNRKDTLQWIGLHQIMADVPTFPIHYVPSSEHCTTMALRGHGYGMVPEHHYRELETGTLVPIHEDGMVDVPLYWHRWNLESELLDDFTATLIQGGAQLLRNPKQL